MSNLGLYFGPSTINIVESQGNKILKHIKIPTFTIAVGEALSEKVTAEVKIATIIKDEFKKHEITGREVTVTLSGQELVVRNFDMIAMPSSELSVAINFEAKKYIPFKLEEMVFDYQWKFDNIAKKNKVLFLGTKKEVLDKYINALKQAGLKINAVEYSAFSLLRLVSQSAPINKGVLAVMAIDSAEEDEANFVILEDGFPLFSRDVMFGSASQEAPSVDETPADNLLEKIKRETRISFDYFHRKYPQKNIAKVLLVCSDEQHTNFEVFIKEMGMAVQYIDTASYIGKVDRYSLGFIKGYSATLSKSIKIGLTNNLLTPQKAIKAKGKNEIDLQAQVTSLLSGVKLDIRVLMLGAAICISVFMFGMYRTAPLQGKFDNMTKSYPVVTSVKRNASYEELTAKESEFNVKNKQLRNLIKEQVYLTELLNVLPRLLADGVWLENLSFKSEENKLMLTLAGSAYFNDGNKEFEEVNNLVGTLQNEPVIKKYFKEITLVSLDRKPGSQDVTTASFIILCQSVLKKGR